MAKIGPKEAARRAAREASDAVNPSPKKIMEVSKGLREALGNPELGAVIKVRVPPSFIVPTVAQIEADLVNRQKSERAVYMRAYRKRKAANP